MSAEQAAPQRARAPVSSTLGTRLAIALIAIVITAAISMLFVSQHLMRTYHEELTQQLNGSIAMYISEEHQLLSADRPDVDLNTIRQLSRQAMIINPIAEVYLLDTRGRIIAHALPDDALQLQQLPLAPIEQFLSPQAELPVRGPDPRNPDQQKIFSATELRVEGQLRGYLYVVLGSKVYDDIGSLLSQSYSGTLALISIVLIAVMAIVTGLLIFKLLLSRLHSLTDSICRFSRQHAEHGEHQPCTRALARQTPQDEIALLSTTFNQMSAQIDDQFRQLKEADAARRELISNVSHDLRTPLASMRGYMETLIIKDGELDAAARQRYLKTALSSANRLNRLIGELFELSRLEAPATTLNLESFSLTELVYDTVQKFELELADNGIQWQLCSQQQNILVRADISLIQRVFENLVRNAIAYTPKGGTIRIELEPGQFSAGAPARVRIIDSGCGISESDLPHIFERFFTNPDRSREGTTSTGLGLAIVKRILDLHQSEISVQSQLNQGTRFEFDLPEAA